MIATTALTESHGLNNAATTAIMDGIFEMATLLHEKPIGEALRAYWNSMGHLSFNDRADRLKEALSMLDFGFIESVSIGSNISLN